MNTVPLPTAASYRFDVASRQSVGAREAQEDSFTELETDDGRHIAIVSDGMGGHVGGAAASKLVAGAVAYKLKSSDSAGDDTPGLLANAVHLATVALADEIRTTPELDGMGSTLVAAVIHEQDLHWASVGDSHLYLFRSGKLRCLNEDHSMAPMLDELVSRGKMTPFEARNHPQRHALRSAITGYEVELVDVPEKPMTLLPGDWLLLASDGLDTLPVEALAQIMTRFAHASAEKMAATIIDAVTAEEARFQDNTTLIAISVGADDQVASEAAA